MCAGIAALPHHVQSSVLETCMRQESKAGSLPSPRFAGEIFLPDSEDHSPTPAECRAQPQAHRLIVFPRRLPHPCSNVTDSTLRPKKPIRWWLGIRLLLLGRAPSSGRACKTTGRFRNGNLITYEIIIVVLMAMLVWWTFLSCAPKRLRLSITFGVVGVALSCAVLFSIAGA